MHRYLAWILIVACGCARFGPDDADSDGAAARDLGGAGAAGAAGSGGASAAGAQMDENGVGGSASSAAPDTDDACTDACSGLRAHDGDMSIETSVPTPSGVVTPTGNWREACSLHVSAHDSWLELSMPPQHQSAVDSNGNLVITGAFYGTLDFGAFSIVAGGERDGFVVKLDADCQPLWGKALGASAGSEVLVSAMAQDDQDNLYLAISVRGTADFGDGVVVADVGMLGVVLKQGPSGELLWSKVVPSASYGTAVTDLVVDGQGRVTLIGYGGIDTSLGGGPIIGELRAGNVPFLAQLDADGQFIFDQTFRNDDLMYGLAIGPGDELWVAGWSIDDVSVGADLLALPGGGRYLARLDSSGNQRWLKALPRGGDEDQWNWWRAAFLVDADGNTFTLREQPVTVADGSSRFLEDSVEKYDAEGNPVWTRRLSEDLQYEQLGHGIALTSAGHVLRLSTFRPSVATAGGTSFAADNTDVELMELDTDGTPLSSYRVSNAAYDYSIGLTTTPADDVFVTYETELPGPEDDWDVVVVKLKR